MPAAEETRPRGFKRLCVFSDGTWQDPEDTVPSNIVRLARAVKLHADDGTPQIVHYDAGIGSDGSFFSQLWSGAVGAGIDRNIAELYAFLAMNYAPGDEILLFGFSRGAYTVRSLAGMIHAAGLVRREHIGFLKEAYELYRAGNAESVAGRKFREQYGGRVPIEALVCFDTVGALGVPWTAPWPLSHLFDAQRYQFHDTTLSELVVHGVHVVSIDEDRAGFAPTPMQACKARGPEQVTERYLPGFHSGVGGGCELEAALADNAVLFVVEELRRRGVQLGLHEVAPGAQYVADVPCRPRPQWYSAQGMTAWAGGGRMVRDIGSIDRVHPVALERFRMVKTWRPRALKRFEAELK